MEEEYLIVECPSCERKIRYPKDRDGLIRCKECLHQFSPQYDKVSILKETAKEEEQSLNSRIPLFVKKNHSPQEKITRGLRNLFITWTLVVLIIIMFTVIEDDAEDIEVDVQIEDGDVDDGQDAILEILFSPRLWLLIFAFIHAYSFGLILSGVRKLFNQQ